VSGVLRTKVVLVGVLALEGLGSLALALSAPHWAAVWLLLGTAIALITIALFKAPIYLTHPGAIYDPPTLDASVPSGGCRGPHALWSPVQLLRAPYQSTRHAAD
jgi:hypothetical protein